MNAEKEKSINEIEAGLAALTTAEELPNPGLWKKAMDCQGDADQARGTKKFSVLTGTVQNRWLRRLVAAVAILAIGSMLITLLDPGLRVARKRSSDRLASSFLMDQQAARAAETARAEIGGDLGMLASGALSRRPRRPATAAEGSAFGFNAAAAAQVQMPAPGGVTRSVIRKATIEMESTDVYGVFQRIRMILNTGRGEYIEESSLSGDPDEHPRAELRLRVAADRLSEVLNELRTLGHVISEKLTGDDVTDQIVDLDARLRNERRVETELLELMDRREDAPLKEILELRREIGNVRSQIERMDAQQNQLQHLVSLATVLVILRTDKDPAANAEGSIGAYFGRALSDGWENALLALADSVASALQILIGGLVWWTIATMAVFGAIFIYRRTRSAPLTTC